MALFKKKDEKSKVDQALELINGFTDEELEEFLRKADLDGDGDVDENDVETPEQEPVEEQNAEENVENEENEEPVEEEVENGEDEENIQDPAPENEEAETPDHYAELKAEIDSIKGVLEGLTARLNADKDNEADKEEFGLEPQGTGKEADGESDLEKAKKKYWAF